MIDPVIFVTANAIGVGLMGAIGGALVLVHKGMHITPQFNNSGHTPTAVQLLALYWASPLGSLAMLI